MTVGRDGPKDPAARARWDDVIRLYKEERLTQKQICERLGLTSGTVSRMIGSDPEVQAEREAKKEEHRKYLNRLIEMRSLGYSRQQMCDELGLTKAQVRHYLQDTPEGRAALRNEVDTMARRRTIEELHLQGMTSTEIAPLVNMTYSGVAHIVRDIIIKRTTQSPEARKTFDATQVHIETLHGLGRIPIPLDLTEAEIDKAIADITKAQKALRAHLKRIRVTYNRKHTDNQKDRQ